MKFKKPFFIAEISANHSGLFSDAKKLILSAKKNGADAVKIQTYSPDTMTIDCDKEDFKIKSGLWKDYKLYDLYKDAPIIEKSTKFFELHSILAPKSNTTLMPFLFGHNADNAGLSMFSIILRFNLAITSNAPVFPADNEISLSDFTWE